MACVILITGGNLGDTEALLDRARSMIDSGIGPVMRSSRLYRTKAWGFDAEGEFVNQVVVAETRLTPRGVLEKAFEIESALGRDRRAEQEEQKRTGQPYGSRAIDIDILFYDCDEVDEPGLKIPHPRLHERSFVLEPLNEVAPDKIHPASGKSVAELWAGMSGQDGDSENDRKRHKD